MLTLREFFDLPRPVVITALAAALVILMAAGVVVADVVNSVRSKQ